MAESSGGDKAPQKKKPLFALESDEHARYLKRLGDILDRLEEKPAAPKAPGKTPPNQKPRK